jgi:hypothetical protein
MKKHVMVMLLISLVVLLGAEAWDLSVGPVTGFDDFGPVEELTAQMIDDTHALNVYACELGFASVLAAHVMAIDQPSGTMGIVGGMPTLIDQACGQEPELVKLDATHFLITWRSDAYQGKCAVLEVNPADFSITAGTPLVFADYGAESDLCHIGDSPDGINFLCTYMDGNYQLSSCVLAVQTSDWSISLAVAPALIDAVSIHDPEVMQVTTSEYLCVYSEVVGSGSQGKAALIQVNLNTGTVAPVITTVFDANGCHGPELTQRGLSLFTCIYGGVGNQGKACSMIADVNLGNIAPSSVVDFAGQVHQPDVVELEQDRFLCAYTGDDSAGPGAGEAMVYRVDPINGSIITESTLTFDASCGEYPLLTAMSDSRFFLSYSHSIFVPLGGRTTLLDVELPAPPVGTVEGVVTEAGSGDVIAGAEIVYINDVIAVTDSSGYYNTDLAPDYYTLICQCDGYNAVSSGVVIEENQTTTLNFSLVPQTNPTIGSVLGFMYYDDNGIHMPVELATIYLDETIVACTNASGCFTYEDEAGIYYFTAEKPGFESVSFEAEIVAGMQINVEVVMIPDNATCGYIQGNVFTLNGMYPVNLPGAEISIADSVWAVSDSLGDFLFPIDPGNYEVHCNLDGYNEIIQTAEVVEDEVTMLSIMMEPVNPLIGTLEGQVLTLLGGMPTPVANAQILHGTEQLAVSNDEGLFSLQLEEGVYALTVEADGYDPLTEEVTVIAGETVNHSFFITPQSSADTPVVDGIALLGNYPNPFNPQTTIQFCCQDASCTELTLQIFNARGQKVRQLQLNQAQIQQGSISWDGTDASGKTASSGLYFYQLLNGTRAVASSRMLLMK